MTKINFTHMLAAGIVASAVAAGSFVASDPLGVGMIGPASVLTNFPADEPGGPGGGGCVNGNCGSGGANGGPGGGPGGNGCVPTMYGTACGSGGVNAGPGGLPGGSGCIPGIGCGGGHS